MSKVSWSNVIVALHTPLKSLSHFLKNTMKWMKENYPDFVWVNVEKEVDFDPEAQSYIVQPHAGDQVNIKGRNAVSNFVIIILYI